MSTAPRLIPVLLVALLGLAGCGSDGDTPSAPTAEQSPTATPSASSGTTTATPEASDQTRTIDITFRGGSVTPSNKKLAVKTGAPLRLHITADQPGEIHVHSSPEQQITYEAGTSNKILKNLDRPGVVDVESHTLDKLILQLEVR